MHAFRVQMVVVVVIVNFFSLCRSFRVTSLQFCCCYFRSFILCNTNFNIIKLFCGFESEIIVIFFLWFWFLTFGYDSFRSRLIVKFMNYALIALLNTVLSNGVFDKSN